MKFKKKKKEFTWGGNLHHADAFDASDYAGWGRMTGWLCAATSSTHRSRRASGCDPLLRTQGNSTRSRCLAAQRRLIIHHGATHGAGSGRLPLCVSPSVSRCMQLVTSPPRAYFSPCLLCLPYHLGLRLPGEEPTPALRKAPLRPSCTWVSRSKIKQLQIVTLIFGNFMQKFCFSSKLKVND